MHKVGNKELEQQVRIELEKIVHPETGKNIVDSGMVENISMDDSHIAVTLSFARRRDPFANSIKRRAKEVMESAFPTMTGMISVDIKEEAPKTPTQPTTITDELPVTTTGGIKTVLAVASGKGGVGKSTVTANIAVSLTSMGYSVGVLDADIYGPSIPKMFGVEDYEPPVVKIGDREEFEPARAHGIKVMSIGFFISPADALVWRGPMATNALRQLIHQTRWGELDFLLIDLPPGTGDVHLTVLREIKVDGTIIVSTPQQVALADVVRGIRMFRTPGIEVPVLGIIENMAWFTPAELPENRYYIFGKDGAADFARKENIPLLGQIPIIQSVMEGAENGTPGSWISEQAAEYYRTIAENTVDNLKY